MTQERYGRQQQVPQLGESSYEQFAAAKVLLVGVGGLGSPVASLLVRAGIGQLTIMDGDVVELSNLHRQTLFTENDIGRFKSHVAQQRLRQVNSSVKVLAHNHAITPADVMELVAQHTVVVDAADNFFTSYTLSDACRHLQKPLVSASVAQTGGHLGVFCGSPAKPAPSYRAIFPSPPEQAQTCSNLGVTGPSVGVVAAYQAQEVIKVVVGDSTQLLGRLLILDLWQHRQHLVDFSSAEEPTYQATLMAAKTIAEQDVVIDVRSAVEALAEPRASDLQIPLSELEQKIGLLPKDQRLVCVCRSGHRALVAAHKLIQAGLTNVAAAR